MYSEAASIRLQNRKFNELLTFHQHEAFAHRDAAVALNLHQHTSFGERATQQQHRFLARFATGFIGSTWKASFTNPVF